MTEDDNERCLSSIALTDYSVGGRFALHVRSWDNFHSANCPCLTVRIGTQFYADALGSHRMFHDQVMKSFQHRSGFRTIFCDNCDEAFEC